MSEKLRYPGPSDERLDAIVSTLLRVGVTTSALIVFCGGVSYLIREGRRVSPDLHEFEPNQLRNPVHILREAVKLDPLGLIMLGLLVLIATPVVRVAFSVGAFAVQRDRLYVLFTLFVLAILVYSLFSGYLSGAGAP